MAASFMAIADLRREYRLGTLRRTDLEADPIAQFNHWFEQATGRSGSGRLRRFFIGLYKSFLWLAGAEPVEVSAATLATADKEGRPSARFVLLKGVDERGFTFFTNYDSRKGQELSENPFAAMVFYWPDLERQVCVAGTVSRLPHEESEHYFNGRPRGSRIAAWASQQSKVVENREVLERRWNELEAKFAQEEVPLPPFWGGYLLSPTRIEFWQGRPSRLHDRFRYTKQAGQTWQVDRLFP
jgi:pyridoxamine 5'-phosphate oxidase